MVSMLGAEYESFTLIGSTPKLTTNKIINIMQEILLLDSLIKENQIISDLKQPIFLSEHIGVTKCTSEKYLLQKLELFQYYLNYGDYKYTPNNIKPEVLSWICSFEDAMDACENSENEDFDESIKELRNTIGTGVTLGSMWINHDILGNQINNLIRNFIFGSNSFFCLSETYHDETVNDKATDFKRKKCTLVTDFTHIYIENKRLNMNVSIRNCDIYDIIECLTLRYFLSKFILSQENLSSVTPGYINMMISNYIVPENLIEEPSIILHKYEIFTPVKNYASKYYDNELCTIYDDVVIHKSKFNK